MNEPVRPPPRVVPRFVPTLTEVVHANPVGAPPPAPAISRELLEEVVEAALRRAEASLARQLPETLSALLHEHALAVTERLRREISSTVRQAVTAALVEKLPDAVAKQKRPSANAAASDSSASAF